MIMIDKEIVLSLPKYTVKTLNGAVLEQYVSVSDIKELSTVEPDFSLYSAEIEEEYMKAKLDTRIKKPLAYALHRVWKKHNGEDKK